jgi:hypothetical protein
MSESMDKGMKAGETTIYTQSILHEQPEAYRILVEMPGVAKESVAVEVEEGILTIEGKKVILPPSSFFSLSPSLNGDFLLPSHPFMTEHIVLLNACSSLLFISNSIY